MGTMMVSGGGVASTTDTGSKVKMRIDTDSFDMFIRFFLLAFSAELSKFSQAILSSSCIS
jgi:hypothetical protein